MESFLKYECATKRFLQLEGAMALPTILCILILMYELVQYIDVEIPGH